MKYFGILNHIKSFIASRIARQLYFAFINARVNYGTEVYGHFHDEHLGKLQTLPNKILIFFSYILIDVIAPWFLNTYLIFMPLVCCVLWITVGPPDAKRLFVIIVKFGKQNVNFVTTTTLRYHWLQPKLVVVHVALKELNYEWTFWSRQFTFL